MLEKLGYDAPPPDSFAVWRLNPSEYDPEKAEGGGRLYETKPSPPMCCVDESGNCWSAQDQDPNLVMINSQTHEVTQIDVPHPKYACRSDMRITGPAIATAPDGK